MNLQPNLYQAAVKGISDEHSTSKKAMEVIDLARSLSLRVHKKVNNINFVLLFNSQSILGWADKLIT